MTENYVHDKIKKGFEKIEANLHSWGWNYWGFFFILIPVILVLIFLLPQNIKDSYLILNTTHPLEFQTYLLNEFTHSAFNHLFQNLGCYFLAMLIIFSLDCKQIRFKIMAVFSFIVIPIVASIFTIFLFNAIGKGVSSQGFSGVVFALLAYALVLFILFFLSDFLDMMESGVTFTGWRKVVYFSLFIILGIILVILIQYGIQVSLFIQTEGLASNGIGHFVGYFGSFLMLSIYGLMFEPRRRCFFGLLLVATMGSLVIYYPYLVHLIQILKVA
jgi:hypothetical protein